MAKYWGTPPFFTQIFVSKMTQSGLKWILNTTCKNMTFWRPDPLPQYDICHNFFFLKASLRIGKLQQKMFIYNNSNSPFHRHRLLFLLFLLRLFPVLDNLCRVSLHLKGLYFLVIKPVNNYWFNACQRGGDSQIFWILQTSLHVPWPENGKFESCKTKYV